MPKHPSMSMHHDGDTKIYCADGKAGIYKLDPNMNSLMNEKVYLGSYVRLAAISLAYGALAKGRFVASKGSGKYNLPSCPRIRKISPES
jgi:hypothetical protein